MDGLFFFLYAIGREEVRLLCLWSVIIPLLFFSPYNNTGDLPLPLFSRAVVPVFLNRHYSSFFFSAAPLSRSQTLFFVIPIAADARPFFFPAI